MAIITLNYNCSSSLPSPLFSGKAQREEEGGDSFVINSRKRISLLFYGTDCAHCTLYKAEKSAHFTSPILSFFPSLAKNACTHVFASHAKVEHCQPLLMIMRLN